MVDFLKINSNNNEYSPADLQLDGPTHDNDFEESDDSDQKRLFELPKRKIRRSPTLAFKRKIGAENACYSTAKTCFRICGKSIVTILVSLFIVATILCLIFLLVGVAGMKEEIKLLKVRTNNVDASQIVSISKTSDLREEFQQKLSTLKDQQNVISSLQLRIVELHNQYMLLNLSIHKMKNSPTFHISKQMRTVTNDIDTIKSGMADTGADIGKLEYTNKQLNTELKALKLENVNLKKELYNLTVIVSVIQNKPIPSATSTPKTLVVTLTPDQDLPITRKEAKILVTGLEKKQKEGFTNCSLQYSKELNDLRNMMAVMNYTNLKSINTLKKTVYQQFHSKLSSNESNSSTKTADQFVMKSTDNKTDMPHTTRSTNTSWIHRSPTNMTPSYAPTTVITKVTVYESKKKMLKDINNKSMNITTVNNKNISITTMKPLETLVSNVANLNDPNSNSSGMRTYSSEHPTTDIKNEVTSSSSLLEEKRDVKFPTYEELIDNKPKKIGLERSFELPTGGDDEDYPPPFHKTRQTGFLNKEVDGENVGGVLDNSMVRDNNLEKLKNLDPETLKRLVRKLKLVNDARKYQRRRDYVENDEDYDDDDNKYNEDD